MHIYTHMEGYGKGYFIGQQKRLVKPLFLYPANPSQHSNTNMCALYTCEIKHICVLYECMWVCVCEHVCVLVLSNLPQFSLDTLSALTPNEKICGPPRQPLFALLLVYLWSSFKVSGCRVSSLKSRFVGGLKSWRWRRCKWETEIEFKLMSEKAQVLPDLLWYTDKRDA